MLGVKNNLDIATEGAIKDGGVSIWINSNYHFKKLPSYLKGAHVFRLPFPMPSNTPGFEIILYRPSTVFISTYHSSAEGGFRSDLENDGWKRFSENIETTWTTLRYMYSKTFTGNKTRIHFKQMSQSFYGAIFVRGKK